MIFYSAEGRGYGVMMALVLLSTLVLLLAVDDGREALVGGLRGLRLPGRLHPLHVGLRARRAVRLGPLAPPRGAPALLLATPPRRSPTSPGCRASRATSTRRPPTSSASLSPFTSNSVRLSLGHWALGFPYSNALPLRDLPGSPGPAPARGEHRASAHRGVSCMRGGARAWSRSPAADRPACVVLLAVVTPLALPARAPSAPTSSACGAWPPPGPTCALAGAALVTVGPVRLRRRRGGSCGRRRSRSAAAKMSRADYERPNYRAGGEYVDERAGWRHRRRRRLHARATHQLRRRGVRAGRGGLPPQRPGAERRAVHGTADSRCPIRSRWRRGWPRLPTAARSPWSTSPSRADRRRPDRLRAARPVRGRPAADYELGREQHLQGVHHCWRPSSIDRRAAAGLTGSARSALDGEHDVVRAEAAQGGHALGEALRGRAARSMRGGTKSGTSPSCSEPSISAPAARSPPSTSSSGISRSLPSSWGTLAISRCQYGLRGLWSQTRIRPPGPRDPDHLGEGGPNRVGRGDVVEGGDGEHEVEAAVLERQRVARGPHRR